MVYLEEQHFKAATDSWVNALFFRAMVQPFFKINGKRVNFISLEKIQIQFYFISGVCLMDQKNLEFLF